MVPIAPGVFFWCCLRPVFVVLLSCRCISRKTINLLACSPIPVRLALVRLKVLLRHRRRLSGLKKASKRKEVCCVVPGTICAWNVARLCGDRNLVFSRHVRHVRRGGIPVPCPILEVRASSPQVSPAVFQWSRIGPAPFHQSG